MTKVENNLLKSIIVVNNELEKHDSETSKWYIEFLLELREELYSVLDMMRGSIRT